MKSRLVALALLPCFLLTTVDAVSMTVLQPPFKALVIDSASECGDLFLVAGPDGYQVVVWLGGYLPTVGDTMEGELRPMFARVEFLGKSQTGEFIVEHYPWPELAAKVRFQQKRESCLPPAYLHPTPKLNPR